MAIVVAVACAVGAVAGAAAMNAYLSHAPRTEGTASRLGNEGLLINPLLSCDIGEDAPAPELRELKDRMQSAADEAVNSGEAKRVSVYVRNMNSGAWTGVNVDDLYSPASLMKLSVLIAYLKNAGQNPSILETRLPLSAADQNAQEFFKPSAPLAPGKAYSVRELLLAMIQNSDNNAADALKDNIDERAVTEVIQAFNEPLILESEDYKNLMSPKVYMRFFRILYNASYLSKDISQQVLSVLTQTTFKDGLAAGVPAGVPVAHKFGERTIQDGNIKTGQTKVTSLQLHDCGIVYDARGPYGICVMTEGDDFRSLASAIARISKETYSAAEAGLFGPQ